MKQGIGKRQNQGTTDTAFVVTEPSGLLDFLLEKLSKRARNHVKSLLTHRNVLVDGAVVTQYNHPLQEGQTVRILSPLVKGQKREEIPPILYEDNDWIVINKPAGLLSIATESEKESTAYRLMTDYVRRGNPDGRLFIVHRLDRDTSGVLLFAKNEKMKHALQEQWSALVSQRGYVAVVEGKVEEKSGRIQSWLKETKTLLMYSSERAGSGLKAITQYQVIQENKDYSLLNIQLETGRKNQIRVHMKDLGHPVVGDRKYGAKTNPLKRLGLHAGKLELRHPDSRQLMCFEAEMPKAFQTLFQRH